LEYDHDDGIAITGGFVYRGSAIPELYGKYVFGDLALIAVPTRIDGRLFYADLTTGQINEFRLPFFPNGKLPDPLPVRGLAQDGNGELYALVTNTPANGNGGIVYRIDPVTPIGFNLEPESIKLGTADMSRVHAFLQPSAPLTPQDIDVSSIRLNNVLAADLT